VGLKARLAIIISLGLGISLVVSLVALVRMEQRGAYEEAAERAEALLRTLQVPMANMIEERRIDKLEETIAAFFAREEVLDLSSLLLLDADGRSAALGGEDEQARRSRADDPFLPLASASPIRIIDDDGGFPRRVAVPIYSLKGERLGTLVGTLSEPSVARRLKSTQLRVVLVATLVSVVGLIGLLIVISVWVLEPLREVSEVAQAFSRGDMRRRAPVRGGGEVALLAEVLNSAAERIGRHTAELEAEVRIRTEELELTNRELVEANARLTEIAITDGLTGLFNLRHFRESLDREIKRQERGLRPFSIVMIDVDHFKHYNDTHGHPAGDVVLRDLAALLHDNVRAADIVARYGGEEFILMLVDASMEDALARAERLRSLIELHPFDKREQQPMGVVSVSMGVATWPENGRTAEQIIKSADEALYASKHAGRNRVTGAKRIPEQSFPIDDPRTHRREEGA